jgi:hypothetical protein
MSEHNITVWRGQLVCALAVSLCGAMAHATGGRVVGRRLPEGQWLPAAPRLVSRGVLLPNFGFGMARGYKWNS